MSPASAKIKAGRTSRNVAIGDRESPLWVIQVDFGLPAERRLYPS